jgi:hypothetical protein
MNRIIELEKLPIVIQTWIAYLNTEIACIIV